MSCMTSSDLYETLFHANGTHSQFCFYEILWEWCNTTGNLSYIHTVLDIEFYKVVINTENVKHVNYLFYVFNTTLVKTVFCAKFFHLIHQFLLYYTKLHAFSAEYFHLRNQVFVTHKIYCLLDSEVIRVRAVTLKLTDKINLNSYKIMT